MLQIRPGAANKLIIIIKSTISIPSPLLISEAWPTLPTRPLQGSGREGLPGSGVQRSLADWALGPFESVPCDQGTPPVSLGTHCTPRAFLRTKTLPRITIETWSFQSTCGMPTRSGLAKAYKHVTTQVTSVQKQAPKPLGKLVLGKDKRKSVTHKLFRVYKPLICAKGSRSCTRSINKAP